MRAHELQRENAHANRDEQQREEYRELFSIDPQSAKKIFHAKAQRSQRRKENLARRCAFAIFAPLREIFI